MEFRIDNPNDMRSSVKEDPECLHSVSRAISRASQHAKKEATFSSGSPELREKMTAADAEPLLKEDHHGDRSMEASDSWFRRLWEDQDHSSAKTVVSPERDQTPLGQSGSATASTTGNMETPDDRSRRSNDSQVRASESMRDVSAGAIAEVEAAGSSEPKSPSGNAVPAGQSSLPTGRRRPPRPLSYRQLSAATRLPAREDLIGSTDSGVRVASTGPTNALASSGSRRTANPFDRASFYRPSASNSELQFEEAFTTAPKRSGNSPGRWDPIPPLRPSSWRDSGSFRNAGNTPNPDDPWNWKPNAPQGTMRQPERAQTPSGNSAEAVSTEEAEPTLTRQWGLLSRFQQARGLGRPNRRASDDSSGNHEVAAPGTTQDHQKG